MSFCGLEFISGLKIGSAPVDSSCALSLSPKQTTPVHLYDQSQFLDSNSQWIFDISLHATFVRPKAFDEERCRTLLFKIVVPQLSTLNITVFLQPSNLIGSSNSSFLLDIPAGLPQSFPHQRSHIAVFAFAYDGDGDQIGVVSYNAAIATGKLSPSLLPLVQVSQVQADAFAAAVLRHRPDLQHYLDIGSHDGITISNTYALDKVGWEGVCVDPFPTNMHVRSCKVIHSAVSGDGSARDFMVKAGALAGFRDSLGRHRDVVNSERNASEVLPTITTRQMLEIAALPRMVGYVNLDIEGAEVEVLESWPWHLHSIGVLTVEHNEEEPKRTQMREILLQHDMVVAYEVDHDDWYVHSTLADELKHVPVPLALKQWHSG